MACQGKCSGVRQRSDPIDVLARERAEPAGLRVVGRERPKRCRGGP